MTDSIEKRPKFIRRGECCLARDRIMRVECNIVDENACLFDCFIPIFNVGQVEKKWAIIVYHAPYYQQFVSELVETLLEYETEEEYEKDLVVFQTIVDENIEAFK
jgi:hypothetical protein